MGCAAAKPAAPAPSVTASPPASAAPAAGPNLGACPNCGKRRTKTEKFCGGCGKSFPDFGSCSKCGGPRLSKDQKFCSSCGAEFLRGVCKFGLKCFQRTPEHHDKFSHPGDPDYPKCVRQAGVKGEFPTLKACMEFMDPEGKYIVDNPEKVRELVKHLKNISMTDEDLKSAWKAMDNDGNGTVSFSEFVEWAKTHPYDIHVPLGFARHSVDEKLACHFEGCDCQMFIEQPNDNRFCMTCGHKKTLHHTSHAMQKIADKPKYWTSHLEYGTFTEWQDATAEVMPKVQEILNKSVKQTWTRDRGKGVKVPKGYTAVKVMRNENDKIWKGYCLKRQLIKLNCETQFADTDPYKKMELRTTVSWADVYQPEPIDDRCNEWYLWHGTSYDGAVSICATDFKQSLAGTATGTLYGPGTYFTDSCTKADEYAKSRDEGSGDPVYVMLLCRVTGGRVVYTAEAEPDTEALLQKALHGHYDSVVGDREVARNTFKEIVIYASDQVYPEYIVFYTRTYD